ncbi:VSP S8 [Giardia lamblia P15]|uniref:VSP S8 n=1 Tax=Giardia intestinalis (strain P15) TaxID=658858 RepID=E1F6L8_GIAIA|nr:VSP S8 [Giardia lamblia P15]
MLLVIFYLVLSALAIACTDKTQNCAEGRCEMVGDTEVCTQCQAGKVPIDGVCVEFGTVAEKCQKTGGQAVDDKDTACGKCLDKYFMYKGGCYDKTGTPGNTICGTGGDTAGICDTCRANYFKHPDPADTKDSCIPCGDVTGVDYNKGIANCKTCASSDTAGTENAPQTATCTECVDGFSPDPTGKTCVAVECAENCLTCTDEAADKCKSCTAETYFLGAASGGEGRCIKCDDTTGANGYRGITNCVKCTQPESAGPAVCTECAANLYVKADVGVMACVAASECGEGFFPATVGGVKKCVSCDETDNGGVETCAKCALKTPVPETGTVVTCSECDGGKKLSPLKDACLNSCPDGTYDKQNVCTPCHSSCANCTDATSAACTACYPGFVLNATAGASAGTCVQECTGKYAENCADGQCTAVVGGSKYCSKCNIGYAPVDGICVSTTARAVEGCNPGQDGTCVSCKDAYFKESGGCYQSTTYPGNKLCSSAQSGQCQRCANGQTPDSGFCPACATGCATCETTNAQQCKTCLPGRYLDSNKACKLCTETSGNTQGVDSCISCLAPTSPNTPTPVICYVTKDDGSGGNGTNKSSNLSTGAIAGIAVAVIVVVGGLVGFLCWWFICRDKA